MGTADRQPGGSNGERSLNIAFVLLSEPRLPDAEAIVRVFRDFGAPGESLQLDEEGTRIGGGDQVMGSSFNLSTGERSYVMLVPNAVPKGEADRAARYSLSSFRDGWRLPSHCAHLLVTFHSTTQSTPKARLSRLTSLLAAVTKVSPAVGVYWGNAGATHDPKFFTSLATDQGTMPRIMLWSGISIARETDGRVSLLSLGMKQLDLPNLFLVAGKSSEGASLGMVFDLLAYVADRGAAIPEGQTVGRTNDERLPVRYVPSPADPSTTVWRVELP